MHSIVMTFRGAVIKVEVANFCAAMDTLTDQDVLVAKAVMLIGGGEWGGLLCPPHHILVGTLKLL